MKALILGIVVAILAGCSDTSTQQLSRLYSLKTVSRTMGDTSIQISLLGFGGSTETILCERLYAVRGGSTALQDKIIVFSGVRADDVGRKSTYVGCSDDGVNAIDITARVLSLGYEERMIPADDKLNVDIEIGGVEDLGDQVGIVWLRNIVKDGHPYSGKILVKWTDVDIWVSTKR